MSHQDDEDDFIKVKNPCLKQDASGEDGFEELEKKLEESY